MRTVEKEKYLNVLIYYSIYRIYGNGLEVWVAEEVGVEPTRHVCASQRL